MSDFVAALEHYQARCESALEARLPDRDGTPSRLIDAMYYGCLSGGKRLRAMLVYAAGGAFGASDDSLDGPAAAIEMIHGSSLIHDDLAAMDDDALRRGKPTCHRAFDEPTAILAGDALQTLAFEVLSSDPSVAVSPERRLLMVTSLARAAGVGGMAGGQSLDMEATGESIDLDRLQSIHRHKTGALIRASCRLGGLGAEAAGEDDIAALETYGEALGLAFQITDDMLDVTQDSAVLGKTSGADARMEKSTYVALLGLEGAREACAVQHQRALETAGRLGDNRALFRALADYVVSRSY